MKISQLPDQTRNRAFRKLFFSFPKQFPAGLRAAQMARPAISYQLSAISHIVICGMGGSALAGSLLQNLQQHDPRLRKKHLHLLVHRNYGLPPEAISSKSIVVVISYSGNTEEALSSYNEAKKLNLPTLAITSGGKLADLAREDRVPIAKIPENIPPRFAVGYQFGALVGLLTQLGFLPRVFKKETQDLAKSLRPQAALNEAKKILGLFKYPRIIPLIYASPSLEAACYSWKTNIHENAKLPASYHIFPELDHNELNIFVKLTPTHVTALKNFFVVLLQNSNDSAYMKKRIKATLDIIKKSGVLGVMVPITGNSNLLCSFKAYILGLAFSGLLAEKLGIDPIPVPVIETLKQKLTKV